MEGSYLQTRHGKDSSLRAARSGAVLGIFSTRRFAQAFRRRRNQLCDHEARANSARICVRSSFCHRRVQVGGIAGGIQGASARFDLLNVLKLVMVRWRQILAISILFTEACALERERSFAIPQRWCPCKGFFRPQPGCSKRLQDFLAALNTRKQLQKFAVGLMRTDRFYDRAQVAKVSPRLASKHHHSHFRCEGHRSARTPTRPRMVLDRAKNIGAARRASSHIPIYVIWFSI